MKTICVMRDVFKAMARFEDAFEKVYQVSLNEAKEGKGVLTVKDGKMTIHVSLVSKNIVNVFVGTKEEAQADGAELIEPTTDEVTYSDGTTDEVYGFDIPVEKLDEDFNVAIIGKKGTWYDHVVSVSNPYRLLCLIPIRQ